MKRALFGIVMAVVLLSPALVRGADEDEKGAPENGAPRLEIQVVTEGTRPGLLSPLYVSLAGLQIYDGYSTLRGVNRGRQFNPFGRRCFGEPGRGEERIGARLVRRNLDVCLRKSLHGRN